LGDFQGKSQRKSLHFCALLLETKDTKSSARILFLSTNNERSSSIGIVVGKTTICGTETVHRTATKIHRHHAKVEAIALAISTKIRRETASVTDRERVIRFDE
jgi:RNase P protein component